MDLRKTQLLMSATAALTAAPALASTGDHTAATPVAATYAELLTPIPDALAKLRASDDEAMLQEPQLIKAQYAYHHHHHHHHHSRRWYLRNGYIWSGGNWMLRPRHHHHHHHSHY